MSIDGDLVRWEPDLDENDRKEVEAIKASILARASAFRELREKLGMSQGEFAKLIGRSQSNVSKMEARTDTRLALMRSVVKKRGGRLRVVVEFDEGSSFELVGT
ncbi:MAG: helix-turn-helix domain-containing protein [Allosphingosinicella sp.]